VTVPTDTKEPQPGDEVGTWRREQLLDMDHASSRA
jgi:hypothetical protein